MRKFLAMFLSVLMGLFSLAACTSGGGGGGGGGSKFKTDYQAVTFGGAEVPMADDYKSSLVNVNVPGTAITNGTSGTVKIKEVESSTGVTEVGSATFTVDNYGFMNISPSDGDPMFGGATPDASVMFGVDPVQVMGSDEWVNLIIGVKRSSGMTDADGVGPYFCAHIEHQSPNVVIDVVDLTLDGSGGFTSLAVGNGTYSVASDGSLTITPNGLSFTLRGAVRNDGEVFVVHLYDELGIGPEGGALICVKDAGSHTTDDLQGNFRVGIFETHVGSSPGAGLGEVFFDGTIASPVAQLTNTSGLTDEPMIDPLPYIVNGTGYFEVAGMPAFVTSDADFILLIDENNGGSEDGMLVVGTKSVPLGFPSEYYAMSLGGDAIGNINISAFSLNAMGGSIVPNGSGTLGIRTLMDFHGTYMSETFPFTVNSTGFIEVPGATNPAWGFVNTTAKTFFLATTDQTTENYVNLVPGVMAGSGLTNTTATFPLGIYNCTAMSSYVTPSIDLEFTGDGELTIGGFGLFYGLTDDGLFTLHDGGEYVLGMVNPNANMVAMMYPGMTICLKQPATLSIDGIVGTYMFGTLHTDTGSTPDMSAEVGTVTITNSSDVDGIASPFTLYNSTGLVDPPEAQSPSPLFCNTTTNTFELGGAGGIPLWVSDDYNLFVIGLDDGPHQQIIFGIRQ